jgi:ubiquinone/menaquinone biosynthesis C-methylase UbiE
MKAPAVRPYHWLAQYYDDFFLPIHSPLDAAWERLLRRILPGVKTACDLACGTGTTAIGFARRGIRTYALDLSPHMCKLARQKIRGTHFHVPVIQADMRSFKLPERVNMAGFDQLRAWDAAPSFQDNAMMSPGCYNLYLARKG